MNESLSFEDVVSFVAFADDGVCDPTKILFASSPCQLACQYEVRTVQLEMLSMPFGGNQHTSDASDLFFSEKDHGIDFDRCPCVIGETVTKTLILNLQE